MTLLLLLFTTAFLTQARYLVYRTPLGIYRYALFPAIHTIIEHAIEL